jgi:hypothetical protein
MTSQNLENLKYPIGKFIKPESISESQILEWIDTIESLPVVLSKLTKDLSVEQLNWPYRPEGWNIKQVVHHLADSHMNSMIRFKWTLTEDTPTIKAYHEDRWAKLKDDNDNNLSHTQSLLKGLHAKLGILLRSLTKEDLKREFIHPEHVRHISLEETIGIYAWHSKHHVAHIEQALKYKRKFD